MTDQKIRLIDFFANNGSDSIPWFGDLAYWHFSQSVEGSLPQKYLGFEGLLRLHRELGIGFYLGGCKPVKALYSSGNVNGIEKDFTGFDDLQFIFQARKGLTEAGFQPDINISISTPKGELKHCWKYNELSYSWGPVHYMISSKEDIGPFFYWIEGTQYEYLPEVLEERICAINNTGFSLIFSPRTPLMQLITIFAGLENTVALYAEDENLFDVLLKKIASKSEKQLDILLKSNADIVMIPENLSSDIVGKTFYKKFVEHYQKKWISKIKTSGKYALIHMDGYLSGLLKEVAETEPTAIEAITPMPAGDLTFPEVRKLAGDKTMLWGGLPGQIFASSFPENDFQRFVDSTIDFVKSDRHIVLGIGDQFPPDGVVSRLTYVSNRVG